MISGVLGFRRFEGVLSITRISTEGLALRRLNEGRVSRVSGYCTGTESGLIILVVAIETNHQFNDHINNMPRRQRLPKAIRLNTYLASLILAVQF